MEEELALLHFSLECRRREGKRLTMALATGEDDNGSQITLLRTNRSFRLYLLSATITEFGNWFTYVACITMIENILGEEQASGTAISILIALRLLPSVLLSFLGGTLADSHDRRKSIVLLNILEGVVSLLFLVAYYASSIPLLYVMVAVQQSLAALEGPCGSAILPMMCKENELKPATMLNGLVWCVMSAIGAACGGYFVSKAGIPVCFAVDSATFFLSVAVMCLVPGKFDPVVASDKKQYKNVWVRIKSMSMDGTSYICSSAFGGVLFLKASATMLYGASNVLNVSLSERRTTDSADENVGTSSERLGLLHAVVGLGSILGPVVHDIVVGRHAVPAKLQMACIASLLSIAVAFLGIGLFSRQFYFLVLFSVLRSMGAASLWIDSTVVLQRYTPPDMLGRIMAADLALALLAESGSAILCGYLEDTYNLSPESVSLVLASLGFVVTTGWTAYHLAGCGMAKMKKHPLIERRSSPLPIHDDGTADRDFSVEMDPTTVQLLRDAQPGIHQRATTRRDRM